MKSKFISLKRSLALLSALYLTGCASAYTTTGGIAKRDIAPFKGTAYFNKSQDITLFDKEGGLEADLNSEWEKLPNANLSEYASDPRLSAEEITTKDENGKRQEGIIFYIGPDGNKYELKSSNGKFNIERKSEGSGGGGGGGGGGGDSGGSL